MPTRFGRTDNERVNHVIVLRIEGADGRLRVPMHPPRLCRSSSPGLRDDAGQAAQAAVLVSDCIPVPYSNLDRWQAPPVIAGRPAELGR